MTENTKVNSNNVRNILIIGRTGNGKSSLANILINKKDGSEIFKESMYSVSETRDIQVEETEIDGIKYRIIDTVGIGDTKLTEEQTLNKLAYAINSASEGLNQILFVTKGKFTEKEIETYDLMRRVIFDEDVIRYTTIVRTNFSKFRTPVNCAKDKELMVKENSQIADIIRGCNRIIHVDNPSLDADDEDELKANIKKKKASREAVVLHLLANCRDVYKPENLEYLNSKISDYVNEKKLKEQQIIELEKKIRELEEEGKANSEENKALKKQVESLQIHVKKLTEKISETLQYNLASLAAKAAGKVGETVESATKSVIEIVKDCKIM